jgi:diaminohydroxyphosphoribosylaminopyrimidine deaminase / 5-amino-6-(5-phosphoribosylamino)uracil reductase
LTDDLYIKKALRLAQKGEAWVSPNPMVGCIIVKGNRIIGEGYHEKFGGNHAEINAVEKASETIQGSTIYVTLEPCTHHGKTPPCVDKLIALRPARVVIGTLDPNPLVSGTSIDILNRHGIQTTVGVLEEACQRLNERFFKFIRTRIPFITLKFAQTLDGKIATHQGHSRWISSHASRRLVHKLRSSHDAVLVGIGTVVQDDPELTVRLIRGRNPVRIVVDSHLRIPLHANVLKDQSAARTVIATTKDADVEKRKILMSMGIDILTLGKDSFQRVDLQKLFSELGIKDISSVLIEGGSDVITTVLKGKLADRLVMFIAPKLVGKGIEAVGDLGIKRMDDALRLTYRKKFIKDDDLVIDATFK